MLLLKDFLVKLEEQQQWSLQEEQQRRNKRGYQTEEITIKRQVWEILELMEWRFERAEERDALAGNTTEAAKVAAYRKAARDKNNEVEARLMH